MHIARDYLRIETLSNRWMAASNDSVWMWIDWIVSAIPSIGADPRMLSVIYIRFYYFACVIFSNFATAQRDCHRSTRYYCVISIKSPHMAPKQMFRAPQILYYSFPWIISAMVKFDFQICCRQSIAMHLMSNPNVKLIAAEQMHWPVCSAMHYSVVWVFAISTNQQMIDHPIRWVYSWTCLNWLALVVHEMVDFWSHLYYFHSNPMNATGWGHGMYLLIFAGCHSPINSILSDYPNQWTHHPVSHKWHSVEAAALPMHSCYGTNHCLAPVGMKVVFLWIKSNRNETEPKKRDATDANVKFRIVYLNYWIFSQIQYVQSIQAAERHKCSNAIRS